MCVLQGCSSASSTQAGSGSSPTAGASATSSGNLATSPSSSAPASSAPDTSAPATVGPKPSKADTTTDPAIAGSGTFTAPEVSSAIVAHGSYQKINAHRMYVQVCAKKVGNVSAVGVEAIAYNSDYSLQGEIASIILPATPGQQGCTQTYLLYSAHLKVYTFIGSGGSITQKSAMKTIF
jgi:hypothetical protein